MAINTFDNEDLLTVAGSLALLSGMNDRALRRSHHQGDHVRLRRGIYVSMSDWQSLADRERYLAKVRAVAHTRRHAVFGYESAAVLWGFPRFGPCPGDVHLVSQPGSGAHSRAGVKEHRVTLAQEDVVDLDGLRVTSPSRTLIDVARSCSLLTAVVMIDHAVNNEIADEVVRIDSACLAELARARVARRGRVKALAAISATRIGAANPGESWSRLLISQLGMPEPHLQVQHPNPRGGHYYTDFEWPELKIIGEFDGRGKYLKPEFLGRMTAGEAVVAEKIREDHLRADGYTVARWMFDDLRSPARLRAILSRAGVPMASK